ncbi:MAG: hypothetical protein IKZ12_02670, partial [Alistipes sp.]|nr:hypothetical protein [Alistipes sp.]
LKRAMHGDSPCEAKLKTSHNERNAKFFFSGKSEASLANLFAKRGRWFSAQIARFGALPRRHITNTIYPKRAMPNNLSLLPAIFFFEDKIIPNFLLYL